MPNVAELARRASVEWGTICKEQEPDGSCWLLLLLLAIGMLGVMLVPLSQLN